MGGDAQGPRDGFGGHGRVGEARGGAPPQGQLFQNVGVGGRGEDVGFGRGGERGRVHLMMRLFFTSRTPWTERAMAVARSLWASLSTKPLSCTVPRKVSTCTSRARTISSATRADLTFAVRVELSMYCAAEGKAEREAEEGGEGFHAGWG